MLELQARRTGWVVLLLVALAFAGGGLTIFAIAPASRTGAVVMTLVGAAIAAMAATRVFAPPRLVLNPQGFTIRSFGGTTTRSWEDIESFAVIRGRQSFMVAVQLRAAAAPAPPMSDFARGITGYNGGVLPDTFGMPAADLADLLNQWQARYGRS